MITLLDKANVNNYLIMYLFSITYNDIKHRASFIVSVEKYNCFMISPSRNYQIS